MKKVVVIGLLVLRMWGLVGAQGKEKNALTPLGIDFTAVTAGQGTIRINSYGNTPESQEGIGFTIGGVGHLYQFASFVSINNAPVEGTGDPGWSIVSPLVVAGGMATSSVTKGEILQMDFTHEVRDNGNGLVDWFISAEFTNLTEVGLDVCYLPYLDYDLFGSANDDVASYAAVDANFGVPTIRVQKPRRTEIFVFVDMDAISSEYRISAFPSLLLQLGRGQNCVELSSVGSPFGPGDFTSAFKIPLRIAAGGTAAVNLQMGHIE